LTLLGESMVIWAGILVIDPFSQFFKLIFLLVAILVIGTAVATREIEDIGVYSSLVFYATLGMMLVASSGELITLFVSLELATLATFALVGFIKKDPFSSEAALKYFIIGAFSSAIILFGMSLIYGVSGSTYLNVISDSLTALVSGHSAYDPALALGVILLIAGFGFEIAAVPFHLWVPDTYQGAPTTITMLLATGAEAMGFAAVFRIFGGSLMSLAELWTVAFAFLAIITMTWGNVAALAQNNVKRMLAYSSIGHAGYILIALAVITPLGFAGGLLHLLAYVFMTGGAFAVVSFISNTYNAHTYEDYAGLRDVAPVTCFAMVIFLLSLAGVPPLAGFLSKFVLFAAAIGANMAILAVFGIINSAVSLYYYAHVIKNMYFRDLPKKIEKKPEPKLFLFLMAAAVVLTFVIGLVPERSIGLTMNAARSLLCTTLACL
ncbi:MAG: NADH-quinone oxidoreductase subunit N, partial [Candidatus Hydrothermarchaeales archaeon]